MRVFEVEEVARWIEPLDGFASSIWRAIDWIGVIRMSQAFEGAFGIDALDRDARPVAIFTNVAILITVCRKHE